MIPGVLYGRYSPGSKQKQKDTSIEQQFNDCREYCKRNNIQIIKEYADRALTGKTDDRPAFQQMLKDSDKKQFAVVVCWKVDRFARNRYDAAVHKARLKKNGVRVTYAMENISDTPEGAFLEAILEGQAEYYSNSLAQNVRRGMKANANLCRVNGSVPFGYKKGEGGRYEIDVLAAEAVKRVFTGYAAGEPLPAIADELNRSGLKSKTGRPFTINSFQNMLRNERYTGVYIYDGIRIEGGIPQIITPEIFEKVNAHREKKKYAPARGRLVTYYLSGKTICGYCGATIIGTAAKSHTGKDYWYYNCTEKRNGSGCEKTAMQKDLVEDIVISAIVNDALTDDAIGRICDAAMEMQKRERELPIMKELERRLRDVEKRIENLQEAIESMGGDTGLQGRLKGRMADKANIELEIIKTAGRLKPIDREVYEFWLESVRDCTNGFVFETQRSLLEIFVRKVTLFNDKVIIICRLLSSEEDVEISKDFDYDEVEAAYTAKGTPCTEMPFALDCDGGPSGT